MRSGPAIVLDQDCRGGRLLWVLLGCTEERPETVQVSPREAAGPLGFEVTVHRSRPGPVWIECTSTEDPEEEHLVEGRARARRHELALLGLLAQTRYRCTAHAGDAASDFEIETGPLPELVSWTVSGEGSGYTVFNTRKGIGDVEETSWVLMVDPEGQVRWLYEVGPALISDLDVQVIGGIVHLGGGWAGLHESAPNRGVYRDIDLLGNVLVERTLPEFGLGFNHHSERLPDGTTLSLTGSADRFGEQEWVGVGVELWDDERGVIWGWSSQQLIDAGDLPVPAPNARTPFIANAVALVDDPFGEGAWISSYIRQELWRIDLATGELTHKLSPRSAFAVVDAQGNALEVAELPHTQHDPQWTDGPFGPDTRVLLYDNGIRRPGGEYSRVVEYDLDLENRVAVRLWSWTEPGWFDPTMGGVQRLPDDHVLVAQGFNKNKTPDSPETSGIIELGPLEGDTREVAWRLDFDNGQWPIYRAERHDGCALFGSARLCPEIADRLEALRGR